jgi:hypothetical protein
VLPRLASPLLALTAAALLLATCALPSDESDSVFVTIEAGRGLVHRGDALTVQAHAWRGSSGQADAELRGVSFLWSVSDSSVARIVPGEGGRAVVTGLSSGRVTLRAKTKDFEDAPAGKAELRVASTVEIDRVTPDTVAYGEQVTVEGVGLGGVERVFLGDGALIPDSASFEGDSVGAGSMRFWVALPAASDRLLAAAKEGFSASAPDSTIVLSHDVLETGDGSYPVIPLDGPVVQDPDVLFHNPALLLEPDRPSDDYRLVRSDTTRPVTVIVRAQRPDLGVDAVVTAFPEGEFDEDWGMGGQSQRCGELQVPVPEAVPDSVVRVVEGGASRDFGVHVTGSTTAGYSLEVRRGRLVVDSRLQPDRFEPNDQCLLADRNFEDPDRALQLGASPVSEVLTLDYPYDLDWYRIEVPGEFEERPLVTIRANPLPFGAADSSLVRIYLIDPNDAQNPVRAKSPGGAGEQTIAEELETRTFYLVIADEAGVPTRYGFCVALGTGCTLPSVGDDFQRSLKPARRQTGS